MNTQSGSLGWTTKRTAPNCKLLTVLVIVFISLFTACNARPHMAASQKLLTKRNLFHTYDWLLGGGSGVTKNSPRDSGSEADTWWKKNQTPQLQLLPIYYHPPAAYDKSRRLAVLQEY